MNETEEYIQNLQDAIASNPFLTDRSEFEWFQTFHDIGYGLASCPKNEVKEVLGSLYGRLFVLPHIKYSRKLPDIDNKDMIREINVGIEKYKDHKKFMNEARDYE